MVTRIRTVTVLDECAGHKRARAIPMTWRVLRGELPHVVHDDMAGPAADEGAPMPVALARWAAIDCDPSAFDLRLHAANGPVDLHLVTGAPDDERAALEVLTRAQVFLPSPADGARAADAAILERELEHPLEAATFWRARDRHRWVQRLRPSASPALQIAALLHDDQAVGLRADHAQLACNAEAQTLADADALSFFSFCCPGFLEAHGREHTARMIAYALDRLAPGERWRLAWIKLRADVAEIVRDVARVEARA